MKISFTTRFCTLRGKIYGTSPTHETNVAKHPKFKVGLNQVRHRLAAFVRHRNQQWMGYRSSP